MYRRAWNTFKMAACESLSNWTERYRAQYTEQIARKTTQERFSYAIYVLAFYLSSFFEKRVSMYRNWPKGTNVYNKVVFTGFSHFGIAADKPLSDSCYDSGRVKDRVWRRLWYLARGRVDDMLAGALCCYPTGKMSRDSCSFSHSLELRCLNCLNFWRIEFELPVPRGFESWFSRHGEDRRIISTAFRPCAPLVCLLWFKTFWKPWFWNCASKCSPK